MAIFVKGVHFINFTENHPKIESTAFLNQSIFIESEEKTDIALERLDLTGERFLFLNDKYIDFGIKND